MATVSFTQYSWKTIGYLTEGVRFINVFYYVYIIYYIVPPSLCICNL